MVKHVMETDKLSKQQLDFALSKIITRYYKGKIISQEDYSMRFTTGSFWSYTTSLDEAYKELVIGKIDIEPLYPRENNFKVTTKLKILRITFLQFWFLAALFSVIPIALGVALGDIGFTLVALIFASGLLPLIFSAITYAYNQKAANAFLRHLSDNLSYVDYITGWNRPMKSMKLGYLP